jgi:calcium binding protein
MPKRHKHICCEYEPDERGADEMSKDPLQSERLEALLVDCHNEWEQLAALEAYLEEQLDFPFQAVCDVAPVPGSYGIGQGDRVKVLAFLDSDQRWGVMVRVQKERRFYRCPLFRLKPKKLTPPQMMAVDDYRVWFLAVGLPEIVESDE